MRRGWIAQRAPWPAQAQPFSVDQSGQGLRVKISDGVVDLEIAGETAGQGWCRWQGRLLPFAIARQGKEVHVWLAGEAFVLELSERPSRRDPAGSEVSGDVVAQVPGRVLHVLVQEGDHVEAGQKLVVLESMKMEFVVRARVAGVVKRVMVSPGDQVLAGAPLVEVE